MDSSVQVAPVAIVIFALGLSIVFSLRAKRLTFTELLQVGVFAVLVGALAGHGLADGVNGALTNGFHAFGH